MKMSIYIKKVDQNLDVIISEIFFRYNLHPTGKVLIKPNFSGRPPITAGENTSPEVLEAIIKKLSMYDCEILIGHYTLLNTDSSNFTFENMLIEGKYEFLKKFDKVKFIKFDDLEHKEVNIEGFPIKFPKLLDEVDMIINVPKAKTHMITDVSLSIKNLMGFIDGLSRKIFHKFFLDDKIGYLGVHVKPFINIVDGVISMEGNGPHEGKDKITNFIAAGTDMVELDSALSYLMGFDFEKIVHIRKAFELKVGKYASKNELDQYQGMIRTFVKPSKYMKIGRKIFFWPTTSCSLCHEVMRKLKKRLLSDPILGIKFYYYSLFSKKRINIIIGRCEHMEYFENDINICIGVCTKWFASEHDLDFITGCPPSVDDVINFILNRIDR